MWILPLGGSAIKRVSGVPVKAQGHRFMLLFVSVFPSFLTEGSGGAFLELAFKWHQHLLKLFSRNKTGTGNFFLCKYQK